MDVVVDWFRSLTDAVVMDSAAPSMVPGVLQRLAMHLTTWQVTSFLVGEYEEGDKTGNPVFTIADTIVWLEQAAHNNSIVRKLQVVKIRGQAPMPGLHTYRITAGGLQVFPRLSLAVDEQERETPTGRASTGVPGLDEMMGGGIPTGDSVLVAGPSGSGKSVLATQFIDEGSKQGEAGVLVVFEEHPNEYLYRAESLGFELRKMIDAGKLEARQPAQQGVSRVRDHGKRLRGRRGPGRLHRPHQRGAGSYKAGGVSATSYPLRSRLV